MGKGCLTLSFSTFVAFKVTFHETLCSCGEKLNIFLLSVRTTATGRIPLKGRSAYKIKTNLCMYSIQGCQICSKIMIYTLRIHIRLLGISRLSTNETSLVQGIFLPFTNILFENSNYQIRTCHE